MIQLEGPLFDAVQSGGLFKDSKTFADALPRMEPEQITAAFLKTGLKKGFDLRAFINEHFVVPEDHACQNKTKVDFVTALGQKLLHLEHENTDEGTASTLVPLPTRFFCNGDGNSRECGYWESYFLAIGLHSLERYDLIENIVQNLIALQHEDGMIPSGNRQYYRTRSNPPILVLLVEILFQRFGLEKVRGAIAAVEREYRFWMNGREGLTAEAPMQRRLALMPDGSILNRYWDSETVPRPEAYKQDVAFARRLSTQQDKHGALLQNLRAAAESGWDFSSRWLADEDNLSSVRTTSLVPIDLNSMLARTEILLSKYFSRLGDAAASETYQKAYEARRKAANRFFWNSKAALYRDYVLTKRGQSSRVTLACVLPLFAKIADPKQAEAIVAVIQNRFLTEGGLVTSTFASGQPWDDPNGWAPLQWFAVEGLMNYRHEALAIDIMQRFLRTVEYHYQKHGKFFDKYNVRRPLEPSFGGDPQYQPKCGWTVGVCLQFLAKLKETSTRLY